MIRLDNQRDSSRQQKSNSKKNISLSYGEIVADVIMVAMIIFFIETQWK